jgi:CRP-like cAMP-binding protein
MNAELYEKILSEDNVYHTESIESIKNYIEENLQGFYTKTLFMRGEKISDEGSADDKVYFVERGKVIFQRKDTYGKEYSNGYAMPGEFFGISSLVDMPHEVGFRALTNCNVYVIDAAGVKAMMENNPVIKDHINRMLIATIRLLVIRQGNLIMCGCRATFVNFVKEHFRHYGKLDEGENVIVSLDVNLADIAVILNTTRETLSRIISEMRKEGIIDTKRKFIRIMDLNRFVL